jgi:hypothetical protein
VRLVRYFENWANYLTLHLSIYQNDVFFVVNDISHFLGDVPYLSPEVVNNIFQGVLVFHAINFAQADNYWHLKGKRDPEIV